MRFLALFFSALPLSLLSYAGQFTTVIGGVNTAAISAIATDSSGNTYGMGNSSGKVFVTKLDPNGVVLFTNTYGGKGTQVGYGIAVDSSGNIYVAGNTNSPDFPVSHALQPQMYSGAPLNGAPIGSGFIMKLSNDGSTVLYSTFFGGMLGQSAIYGIATDTAGSLYVTGYTLASDFPHTSGMPSGTLSQSPAVPGAFVASISAAGDKILYSGYMLLTPPCACISAGPSWAGIGIGVDAAGNAYIAGNYPNTTPLPTTAGVVAPKGIGAFVAKINAGGTGVGYLTYLGSGNLQGTFPLPENTVSQILVDPAGNAYLSGTTFDPNFPVTAGVYQPKAPVSPISGYVAKLNPAGSSFVWATYTGQPSPQTIALDAHQNVWIGGGTTAALPPLPNANTWTTGPDFVMELSSDGSGLLYSALYPGSTVSQAIAVDPSGTVHLGGQLGFVSAIVPAAPPAMKIFSVQSAVAGSSSARVSPAEVVAIYGPGIGPAAPVSASPGSGRYPTSLGGVQVSVNGVNVPLLYVSENQINAAMPAGLTVNSSATIHVANGSSVTADFPLWVVASTGVAFPTVFNQDWTVNSGTNPAKPGSILIFYGTGWQPTFAPLADGQTATVAQDFCLGACQASALLNGGVVLPFVGGDPTPYPAAVLYGGAAPGVIAGISQFNVRLGTSPQMRDGNYVIELQGPSGATISASAQVKAGQ